MEKTFLHYETIRGDTTTQISGETRYDALKFERRIEIGSK
ncbi:hypothetical protein QO002_006093 [Pararhizobium capsulatum DSM 1112]|uniref:Uncharacterized protein n=1 Tax=Pararhizobium capsulatum DSM 1112 TaxID=1121113 RepID=A0ABU0C1U7_9HYPH|nr:hypothetical protein [Pararhizobium capsulatum DSM 1112]